MVDHRTNLELADEAYEALLAVESYIAQLGDRDSDIALVLSRIVADASRAADVLATRFRPGYLPAGGLALVTPSIRRACPSGGG